MFFVTHFTPLRVRDFLPLPHCWKQSTPPAVMLLPGWFLPPVLYAITPLALLHDSRNLIPLLALFCRLGNSSLVVLQALRAWSCQHTIDESVCPAEIW